MAGIGMFHPEINLEQYQAFLYVSAGLLGLTTVDGFFKQ
jgi:hypothetical protein